MLRISYAVKSWMRHFIGNEYNYLVTKNLDYLFIFHNSKAKCKILMLDTHFMRTGHIHMHGDIYFSFIATYIHMHGDVSHYSHAYVYSILISSCIKVYKPMICQQGGLPSGLDSIPCFPCVHDQFPCVFQYINIKYYFYKWPPLPFTAILSSLLFNSNIKSSAFDYKNTLPC